MYPLFLFLKENQLINPNTFAYFYFPTFNSY